MKTLLFIISALAAFSGSAHARTIRASFIDQTDNPHGHTDNLTHFINEISAVDVAIFQAYSALQIKTQTEETQGKIFAYRNIYGNLYYVLLTGATNINANLNNWIGATESLKAFILQNIALCQTREGDFNAGELEAYYQCFNWVNSCFVTVY